MSNENKVVDNVLGVPEVGIYQKIPIDKLRPFSKHVFKLYQGDALEKMADSIREHGVMQPIIVRRIKFIDEFEIISGHNRVEAAKFAGLDKIPAIVRELSDNDAVILVTETNLQQRSFENWQHSERAKAIHQYHNKQKKQGKRTDLASDTSGEVLQKSDDYARMKTAVFFNETIHTIRLYLDLSKLTDELLDRLDNKEFGISPAKHLSHISEAGQKFINSVLVEKGSSCKITVTNAKELREALKNYTGQRRDEEIGAMEKSKKILTIKTDAAKSETNQEKFKIFKLETEKYEQLFSGKSPEEAMAEILKAVEFSRSNPIPQTT